VDGSPSVEVDARGLGWAKFWFNGKDTTLTDGLGAMPYQQAPWSGKYPALVNILNDEPAIPKGNVMEGNSWYGGVWSKFRDGTGKWVNESGTKQLEAPPKLPLDPLSGEVIQYRVEAVAGNPNAARLVVENLGPAAVNGEALLWTWPEQLALQGDRRVPFALKPGEKLTREVAVPAAEGLKEAWIGVRLKGDDLRPVPLKVTPR
jgi:hypothetical protein